MATFVACETDQVSQSKEKLISKINIRVLGLVRFFQRTDSGFLLIWNGRVKTNEPCWLTRNPGVVRTRFSVFSVFEPLTKYLIIFNMRELDIIHQPFSLELKWIALGQFWYELREMVVIFQSSNSFGRDNSFDLNFIQAVLQFVDLVRRVDIHQDKTGFGSGEHSHNPFVDVWTPHSYR